MSKKPDYYSSEFQKKARLGKYWYDEIWKSVDKCIFCDLREKYIVAEEGDTVLAVNLFPYVDYHLLIIPRKHILSLRELTDQRWREVLSLLAKAGQLLKECAGVESYSFMVREGRGKTVEHLHFHVIPFCEELESWNFQKIGKAPVEVAKELRSAI